MEIWGPPRRLQVDNIWSSFICPIRRFYPPEKIHSNFQDISNQDIR